MTRQLYQIIGALSVVAIVGCSGSTTASSVADSDTTASLDTTITLDTVIFSDTTVRGGDTIIRGNDTIITPVDTVITIDTTVIPVDTVIARSSMVAGSSMNTNSWMRPTSSMQVASSSSIATSSESSSVFTSRDLQQTADTAGATYYQLVSGQDITITTEGVYVISGTATNASIIVNADTSAKVQIVLNGVSITNQDAPAVYVKAADKVFITTTGAESHLEVTGTYTADGNINLDAVIFSKSDLTLNGTGTLAIVSAQGNGISAKDDLKITGGTIGINSKLDGMEANESINIGGGNITIDAGADGIHAENNEDNTTGSVYISSGTLNITAGDDGIRATTVLQVDGGTIGIKSSEGMESTYILVNDGNITISTNDDGLNAAKKSSAYSVLIEVNGGTLNVTVQGGDVDGFDANGSIKINGGTIYVTCPTQPPSGAFDADQTATLNGGTVYVNGTQVTTLGGSMMGPGGRG